MANWTSWWRSSPHWTFQVIPAVSVHGLAMLPRCASTAGANNELKKGRQVTNWIATLTIGTEDHAAWMKVVGA